MQKPQLTIAQRQFLQKFDEYTVQGQFPQKTRHLRDAWKVQHRVINKCASLGLLKRKAIQDNEYTFVVNDDYREVLGLVQRDFANRITRKRSSSY